MNARTRRKRFIIRERRRGFVIEPSFLRKTTKTTSAILVSSTESASPRIAGQLINDVKCF